MRKLIEMFDAHGIRVSDNTVGKLLRRLGYSLQAAKNTVEGRAAPRPQRPVRAYQRATAASRAVCVHLRRPKKKELVGNFKNAGVESQPKGEPELVDVHDFPSDAIGKAVA
jgi:Rhodopirellula transposase DDE domain